MDLPNDTDPSPTGEDPSNLEKKSWSHGRHHSNRHSNYPHYRNNNSFGRGSHHSGFPDIRGTYRTRDTDELEQEAALVSPISAPNYSDARHHHKQHEKKPHRRYEPSRQTSDHREPGDQRQTSDYRQHTDHRHRGDHRQHSEHRHHDDHRQHGDHKHHSRDHRQQNERSYHNRRKTPDQDEDLIAKEKERNKLSLLDGIEEMYKKDKKEPDKTSSIGACFDKPIDVVYEKNSKSDGQDVADNSQDYDEHQSKRPLKWFSTRGGHNRNSHGKDGTYRSYPDEVPESHSQNVTSNNSRYSNSDKSYRRDNRSKQYNSKHGGYGTPQPSAPPVEFDENSRSGHRKRYEPRNDSQDYNYQDSHDMNSASYKSNRGRRPFRQDGEIETSSDLRSKDNRNQRPHQQSFPGRKKTQYNQKVTLDDDATQREMLTEQLQSGEFECMVCCEGVRHRDSVWNCLKCYNLFHLHCIRKWARTPTAIVEGSGWRCPTCQDIYENIPQAYYCFCGKVRDPEMSRHDTPHSCGTVCGRSRQTKDCQHHCNILCHPGPCPPCTAMVTRTCECKKIEMQIKCGRSTHLTCDGICEKVINCGLHKCKDKCHGGACLDCPKVVKQDCYCSKTSREVPCTSETALSSVFACDQICNQKLLCGNHFCELVCHEGECPPCKDLPGVVKTCPCEKTLVTVLLGGVDRKQCTDPIPVCKKTCDKLLRCGPEESRHNCYSSCHTGKCPPCPLKTSLRCLCRSLTQEYRCAELEIIPMLKCEKRCNRKKLCGRHKCLNTCCIDWDHVCELVCNRKLTCGLHQCPEPCHKGNCRTCSNVSFEDLTCYCGIQVVMAPIACGTKPPECNQICIRQHACEHAVLHNCHSDEQCPPCTALTEKWCFGGHEKRNHVPCHLSSLSCGLHCNKPISCGQHLCPKICHEGFCESENSDENICTQACVKKRTDCEHICGAICHRGSCPADYPCKTLIPVSCKCGTRTEDVPCSENIKLFKQLSASMLASKMQDIQLGNSVDISDVLGNSTKKNKLRRIECNEECSIIERNRRLALALQIRNPDLSSNPGPPKYSDFLKDECRKNPVAVKTAHDKLTELVQLAKQSKQKSRSHSFSPMNRDQRRIIHELAEFFGCDSESFDQEPKRNVVVTAFRDRSFLPSTSVLSIVQREMGMRKMPLPVMTSLRGPSTSSANKINEPSAAAAASSQGNDKSIDYFDF